MKYLKVIYLPVLLLPVFAFLSDWSLSQVKKFSIRQDKALEIKSQGILYALSMEGVIETPPGSNSSNEISEFLRSVNLREGNEWCVAFCQWAYRKAAGGLKVKLNLLNSGHSLAILNYAKNFGRNANPHPEKGDWIIFQRGSSQKGHCGIVLEFDNNIIKTIEGNVQDEFSNNQGVFRKQRKLNNYGWLHVVGFIGFE